MPTPAAVVIYGIPNCGTMKKARVWLDTHGVAYRFHDYRAEGIDRKTVAGWVTALAWEKVLNRASTAFKSLPARDRDKENLDSDKAIALMLANPTMIKRPMLDVSGQFTAGFKPNTYSEIFRR